MEWIKLFPADTQPSEKQISDFIASPLWTMIDGMAPDIAANKGAGIGANDGV